jgi:hypothetical protein
LLEGKCSELGFDLFGQMLLQGERFANEYPRQLVVRELIEVSILLYMGYTQQNFLNHLLLLPNSNDESRRWLPCSLSSIHLQVQFWQPKWRQ